MTRLAKILALIAFVVGFQGNALAHASQGASGVCAMITQLAQTDGEVDKGVVAPDTPSPSCKLIGALAGATHAPAPGGERVRFDEAEQVLISCSLSGQEKPPKAASLTT